MSTSTPVMRNAPVTSESSPCLELYQLPHVSRIRLEPGAVLRVPEPEETAVCVESGALAIEILDPQNGTSIIEVLGAGACCSDVTRGGNGATPGQSSSRMKSALVALAPTSVLMMPMSALFDHLASDPGMTARFFKSWTERYRAWAERLAVLRAKSPLRRTAGTLLYLVEQMAQPCPLAPGARILLTQDIMARIADLSRQTLNRELQQLQASGIVRLGRSMVCVLDRTRLQAVYDGDLVPHETREPVPCQLLNPAEPLACQAVAGARV